MADELKTVLVKSVSPNIEDQQLAYSALKTAYESNYIEYVKSLSELLHSTELDGAIRASAGLALKNCVASKDDVGRHERFNKWTSMPVEIRNHVKNNILTTLGTEVSRPSQAAQCVAGVACIEWPRNEWQEAIVYLMNHVTVANSTESMRESSLEALGYICQDIYDPQIMAKHSNEILTAIVNGMKKDEPSERVRLAATTALLNSLEYIHNNFAKDNERHMIMQVICESTQSNNSTIKVRALQCLVKIMSLYYSYMEHYMGSALFAVRGQTLEITLEAMKAEQEEVCLQGIEFWSNVCDEEIELHLEAEESLQEGRPPENVSKFYAKGAIRHLVPILVLILTKQEETDDDDEWNPCKAAGVCLNLLAQCVGYDVAALVLPFVEANITSSEFQKRDAAVMALGSVMDVPEKQLLEPIVKQALPLLIGLVNDSHLVVRDSTCWCIEKIIEVAPALVVQPACLEQLLPALYSAITQEPRVAAQGCWAISALSVAAYEKTAEDSDENGNPRTYVLSPVFNSIIDALLKTTDRSDAHKSNLRNAAFEALMSMIKNSAKDCYDTVQKTTLQVLKKMEMLICIEENGQITSSSDKSQFRDLQSCLCGMLQSVLRKMTKEDALKISENVMSVLSRIMSHGFVMGAGGDVGDGPAAKVGDGEKSDGGGVMEDALFAVSVLIEKLGVQFLKFMDTFKPFLLFGLKNYRDYMVCMAAVGVVGDLCRALEGQVAVFMDEIMELLGQLLQNDAIDKSVRSSVISTFGDIGLALGPNFERYSTVVMGILQQASMLQIENQEDYDEVELFNTTRESVLEAYQSIVQGYKGSYVCENDATNNNNNNGASRVNHPESLKLLEPYVTNMIAFIDRISAESHVPESVIANTAGLIGDLVTAYGKPIMPHFDKTPTYNMLMKGRKMKTQKAKSLSTWALKEMRKLKIVQ